MNIQPFDMAFLAVAEAHGEPGAGLLEQFGVNWQNLFAQIVVFLAVFYILTFLLLVNSMMRHRLTLGEISIFKVVLISVVQLGLLASIALSLLPEDFGTPEQHITPEKAGRAWEACMTFNGSWGYMPSAIDWRPVREVISMLRLATAACRKPPWTGIGCGWVTSGLGCCCWPGSLTSPAASFN